MEITTKLRKWGNSLGIVVPREILESNNAKEGDEVTILFRKNKKNKILKEMFGTFKFDKSVDKIMREVDQDLYND